VGLRNGSSSLRSINPCWIVAVRPSTGGSQFDMFSPDISDNCVTLMISAGIKEELLRMPSRDHSKASITLFARVQIHTIRGTCNNALHHTTSCLSPLTQSTILLASCHLISVACLLAQLGSIARILCYTTGWMPTCNNSEVRRPSTKL